MTKRFLTFILSLALLLIPVMSAAQRRETAAASLLPPPETAGITDVSTDWRGSARENIHQGEYQIAWQERANLADLPGVYQAPRHAPVSWGDRVEMNNRSGPVSNWFLISPLNTPEASEWYPSVAYNSWWQEYLVVWYAATATNKYIYGQFLDRNGGKIGDRFMISSPIGNNMYPDVVYNPTHNEYLVVYMVETATAGVYGIYGMRLNAFGSPQEGERCFAVSSPTYTYWNPAVAYSIHTDEYLVVWQREWSTALKGIEARTLSGDGATMGPILEITGLQADVAPSFPDVAYTRASNEFLVVWQRWYDSTYSDHDIVGRRIGLTGGAHLEGSVLSIHLSTSDEILPAVASVPRLSGVGEYLITCGRTFGSSTYYITGQLLTDAGALDGPPFIISPDAAMESAVASNDNTREFLAAWDAGDNIQARTVSTSGSLGPYDQALPDMAYADTPAVAGGPLGDYLVACHNQAPGYNFDVFGFLWGVNRVFLPLVVRGS